MNALISGAPFDIQKNIIFARFVAPFFAGVFAACVRKAFSEPKIARLLYTDVVLLHESFALPPVHFGSVNSRRLPRHQLVPAVRGSANLSFRDIGEVRDAVGLCFFAPLAAK